MKCPFVIKVCTKCKRILVANTINFVKLKHGKYGVASKCKMCNKKEYEENIEERREKLRLYNSKNKDGRKESNKKYYENNKEDIEFQEKRKKYREDHKEEKKKQNKKYQQENAEKIKKQRKEHYEKNKEKLLEEKREYSKNNPHINFNNHVKRRQLEENQGNGITKDQWFEMMEFFNWCCAYSGISLNKDNRSIDHIISLNQGGEHEVWNCVPMYVNYNSSKNSKDMLEWYSQQDYFLEERLNKIYEWIEYAKSKYQKD